MLPGTPARTSHDYVRHGTSSLYAALDLTTGKVIGALHSRHRATEFLAFLKRIDAEVPADLDVHLVLDNARGRKIILGDHYSCHRFALPCLTLLTTPLLVGNRQPSPADGADSHAGRTNLPATHP